LCDGVFLSSLVFLPNQLDGARAPLRRLISCLPPELAMAALSVKMIWPNYFHLLSVLLILQSSCATHAFASFPAKGHHQFFLRQKESKRSPIPLYQSSRRCDASFPVPGADCSSSFLMQPVNRRQIIQSSTVVATIFQQNTSHAEESNTQITRGEIFQIEDPTTYSAVVYIPRAVYGKE